MNERDIVKQIDELETLASNILKLKQETLPRRPIVIEFCGTPKAGKTSCLSSLNLFLRRNGFTTKLLTERASVCPISDKFSPFFNIWTSNTAIAELSAVFIEQSRSLDVIIADRAIFDALCWFEWQLTHSHISETDYNAIRTYLTSDKLRSLVDLVYIFKVNPEVSLQREYANLLTRKSGSVMNSDVIQAYNLAIETTIEKYGALFRCVSVTDTSEFDQNTVSFNVTKEVLTILNNIVSEKIGFVERDKLPVFTSPSRLDDIGGILKLQYQTRDEVEKRVENVQPIPVVVLTNAERTKVFVVRKNSSSTTPDSPERSKTLIYIGGHIREEDNLHGSDESFLSIARRCLEREVQEELSVSVSIRDENPMCIWNKEHSKSRHHLAVVFVHEVNFEHFRPKLDEREFTQKKGKTRSGKVLTLQEVMTEDLEDWTRLILQHIFEKSQTGQLELNTKP